MMAEPTGSLQEGAPQDATVEGAQEEPARGTAATASSLAVPVSGENSEYECRICYHLFDLEHHAPKLLECLHTFCLQCLSQLHLRAARSPPSLRRPDEPGNGSEGSSERSAAAIKCPLCWHPTALLGGSVHSLPNNTKRVEAVVSQMRGRALLLQHRRFSQAVELARQRHLSEQSGEGAVPWEASLSSDAAAEACSQEPGSALCCSNWRKVLMVVCFVSGVLLLVFAGMEWIPLSIFLLLALALIFCSTIPFAVYRFQLRRQNRSLFLRKGEARSPEVSPGCITPRNRSSVCGRSPSQSLSH